MATTYSNSFHGQRSEGGRPAGLMRVFAFLQTRVAPLRRDDRAFAGPGFAQQVPDLAAEAARRGA